MDELTKTIGHINTNWSEADKVTLINELVADLESDSFLKVFDFVIESAIDEAEQNEDEGKAKTLLELSQRIK